jgi:hypothetical protein
VGKAAASRFIQSQREILLSSVRVIVDPATIVGVFTYVKSNISFGIFPISNTHTIATLSNYSSSSSSSSQYHHHNNNMVATRRSLGGHPSPAASSPPGAATVAAQLSRVQQAALKKLTIAGTDALKGDPKAAQAAKEAVQTYHYRGAVYAADANTPSSWIENQPKRYLKRSRRSDSGAGEAGEGSIAVSEERGEDEDDEEEEDEEEETRRPTKRQKKSRHSMPQQGQGRNHKPVSQTATSSRGKARAARGGRHSLPAKRKPAEIHDNNNNNADDDDDGESMEWDYANVGGRDECVILDHLPNWLGESEPARRERLSHRVNPIPTAKSPIPNRRAISDDIQRGREEAARKNYQVEPLGQEDMMSEEDLARAALVKLAKKQRQLNEKMIEWRMAKELLEAKKKEAEAKAAMSDTVKTAPEQRNDDQPAIDQTHAGKGADNEIDEQWEREQEQNRARNKSKSHHDPEIRESSSTADSEIPYISNATYHPFTKAGASRPSTPLSATKTPLTGPNTLPHSARKGYTMLMPASTPDPSTPTSGSSSGKKAKAHSSASPKNDTDVAFSTLPPNAPLPTHSAGGDPMRWSIQQRVGRDSITGEERAEYAIDTARLEGESKSSKIRRVKRERAVVESWSKVDGSEVVELGGRGE